MKWLRLVWILVTYTVRRIAGAVCFRVSRICRKLQK